MPNQTFQGLEIPLALAAKRLKLSWAVTWRLVLTGKLQGRQERGRWFVSQVSLEALRREQSETSSHPDPTILTEGA